MLEGPSSNLALNAAQLNAKRIFNMIYYRQDKTSQKIALKNTLKRVDNFLVKKVLRFYPFDHSHRRDSYNELIRSRYYDSNLKVARAFFGRENLFG